MICPKCKKETIENALKCNHCGAKIASLCKKCNAYNPIFNLSCQNCQIPLLKICPHCKGVNLPESATCRKCGEKFALPKMPNIKSIKRPEKQIKQTFESETPEQETIEIIAKGPQEETSDNISPQENLIADPSHETPQEEVIEPFTLNYNVDLHSQSKAKDLLVEGLVSNNKRILSVSGEKGIGKSIVLTSAVHGLKDKNITWLLGECSAITQLSPCGLLQDILLTFFNITNFCSDNLKLKKESQRFFQTEFPTLTNEEIFNLLNLLYPSNTDYFENILLNKEKTFILLQKVFKTVIEKNKTVFIIENFDLIDGFSYEFLHNLLNSELAQQFKVLITYSDLKPSRGYLYCEQLDDSAYLDISLSPFDKNQMSQFIDQYFTDTNVPDDIKQRLYGISAGSPAVLEQCIGLLIDFNTKNGSLEISLPNIFDNIVNTRLSFLSGSPDAYKVLLIASIQGNKFYPSIINEILKLEESQLKETLNQLQNLNYIVPVNDFAYSFKNSLLWMSVLESAKKHKDFSLFNESLFSVYSNYTLSSNSIMAIIAQNLDQDLSALAIWTDNIKLSAYIGDANLYTISQKQSLMLVEKLEHADSSLIKNNIYERLGKLLSKTNPHEAINYLPNAISNARKLENTIKEIELTGYLANCCISLGDYHGVLECVNTAIEKIDPSFELEVAMLKSRKLNALLSIGNSGEIVNLIDNEIMPIFDKYISGKPHKTISISSLYKAWLQSYLSLANALIMQGNNRSFEILSTLFDLFQKNNFDNKLFICKAKLSLAFANTIKGDIEASEEILEEIIKTYRTDIMDNEAISRWNLINILNNFIQKKYTGIKEELFQVVTFANNVNDHFTKNILKTLLGKLFKDEENAKQALDIYSEQVTYFAKEKNAIGALLSWYLIADANLVAEGPEKSLEVSQKALDVAQSPKINNYFFMCLFNKVIAEAFMVQAEYEMAKVHIEKAIMIARKFELLNLLADLYLLYGKYLQDIALIKTEAQGDYVLGASKMYKKAGLIAQGIKNSYLVEQIDKSKSVLNSFCQLNGIILHDT